MLGDSIAVAGRPITLLSPFLPLELVPLLKGTVASCEGLGRAGNERHQTLTRSRTLQCDEGGTSNGRWANMENYFSVRAHSHVKHT